MLSEEARIELGLDDIDPGPGPDYTKEPNS